MDEQVRITAGRSRSSPANVYRTKPVGVRKLTEELMSTSHEHTSLASLVSRVHLGDREAFCRLVRPHELTIYKIAWALSVTDAAAEEIAQEGIARAWREFKGFSIRTCLRRWLATKTIEVARTAGGCEPCFETSGEYTPSHFNDWQLIPANALEDRGVRSELRCALRALPLERREVFVLRDMVAFTAMECAAILMLDELVVRRLISWARLQFRDELAVRMQRRTMKSALGGGQ